MRESINSIIERLRTQLGRMKACLYRQHSCLLCVLEDMLAQLMQLESCTTLFCANSSSRRSRPDSRRRARAGVVKLAGRLDLALAKNTLQRFKRRPSTLLEIMHPCIFVLLPPGLYVLDPYWAIGSTQATTAWSSGFGGGGGLTRFFPCSRER